MKTEFFSQTELVPCYRERKQDRCSECRLRQAVRHLPNDYDANMEALAHEVLDPARRALGFPIHVNSGFRCLIHNAAVGGAKNSQHTLGQAADIRCDDLPRLVELIGESGKYDQLIIYPTFVHISYKRRGPNRRQKIWKK